MSPKYSTVYRKVRTEHYFEKRISKDIYLKYNIYLTMISVVVYKTVNYSIMINNNL